jgi:hypothetical protein
MGGSAILDFYSGTGASLIYGNPDVRLWVGGGSASVMQSGTLNISASNTAITGGLSAYGITGSSLSLTGTTIKTLTNTILSYITTLTSPAQAQINNIIPAGTIIASAGVFPPSSVVNYALCDGKRYITSAYPALFASIGNLYAPPAGITPTAYQLRIFNASPDNGPFEVVGYTGPTFYVPNFQGAFLRGYGAQTAYNGTLYTSTANFGVPQLDGIGLHSHNVQSVSQIGGLQVKGLMQGTEGTVLAGASPPTGQSNPPVSAVPTLAIGQSPTPTADTRPFNYSVYYYIKT